jgi:hypothetical protein
VYAEEKNADLQEYPYAGRRAISKYLRGKCSFVSTRNRNTQQINIETFSL